MPSQHAASRRAERGLLRDIALHQTHPAARAGARLISHDVGVHRADVTNGSARGPVTGAAAPGVVSSRIISRGVIVSSRAVPRMIVSAPLGWGAQPRPARCVLAGQRRRAVEGARDERRRSWVCSRRRRCLPRPLARHIAAATRGERERRDEETTVEQAAAPQAAVRDTGRERRRLRSLGWLHVPLSPGHPPARALHSMTPPRPVRPLRTRRAGNERR